MAAHHVTVAVIGGGPAGSSAALTLSRAGIDALLLERSDGAGNCIGETLAPSANPLLHQLGLHDVLAASGALPSYGNRSSWGGDGALEERDFLRDPHGHGWHLNRPAFNAALLDASAKAGVCVWRNAQVTSLQREERSGYWRLNAATPDGTLALTASFFIDATGRSSLVSRHLGIRKRQFDRQVTALAILQREPDAPPPPDTTTLIEAVESGWWYSAFLPAGQLVVAWFTDPDLLARDEAWHVARWWELLRETDATWRRVSAHQLLAPGSIQVLATGSNLLPQPFGEGWIAAGDAATAFDPLSSHGIGSALAGGRNAARTVLSILTGNDGALSRYADTLLADYARYLWLRQAYYAEEQRWPHAPFWERRHTQVSPPHRSETVLVYSRQAS